MSGATRGARAMTVAAAAVLFAACGSSTGTPSSSAAASAQSTGGALTSPAEAATASASPQTGDTRRSEPYWVPVSKLQGTDSTTGAVNINNGALQWRVVFHCQSAPFKVAILADPAAGGGGSLVNAGTCSGDNQAFSAQTGQVRLKITATGAWDITVDQQIDDPLVEPPTPQMVSAAVAGTGKVYPIDKEGEGTARLYRLGDGTYAVRLESFYTTQNHDLIVRFSTLAAPKSTDEVASNPFTDVAPLKATVGSMNYPVPPTVDVSRYHSIVFWCEVTRNAYAAVTLTPAG